MALGECARYEPVVPMVPGVAAPGGLIRPRRSATAGQALSSHEHVVPISNGQEHTPPKNGTSEMLKRLLPVLGTLLLVLSSCASTSAAYVKHSPNMSVVRGKIVHVENLKSHHFVRLSDGIAFTVGSAGCKVKIRLSKKNEQTYHVEPGTVIVFGKNGDYIMREAVGFAPSRATNSPSTPNHFTDPGSNP